MPRFERSKEPALRRVLEADNARLTTKVRRLQRELRAARDRADRLARARARRPER